MKKYNENEVKFLLAFSSIEAKAMNENKDKEWKIRRVSSMALLCKITPEKMTELIDDATRLIREAAMDYGKSCIKQVKDEDLI